MEGLKIRYAKKSDFKMLLRESETEWPGWWENNYKFGLDYVTTRLKEKRTLVAVLDGEVVGFLAFGSLWSRHLHIEDLYVSAKYRRLGVASSLVSELVKIAKGKGIRKIVAETDPHDKAVQKLNIKNGFQRNGYIKKLWGETDAIVFTKNLR